MSTNTPGSRFRALIGGALKDVRPLNENADGSDDFAFGGPAEGAPEDGAGFEDEGQEYGGIEEIVTALEDLVSALRAEVFGDDEVGDDIMDDSEAGDDLANVPVKEKAQCKGTVLGTPLKGLKKGETLRSKINRVKGKLNKQGSKAGTTLVTPETSVKSQPKSTFTGKPVSQQVKGQKGTKEDLF